MYSHTLGVVCPPGYVKKLQSPSLDFALRASVAYAPLFTNLPGADLGAPSALKEGSTWMYFIQNAPGIFVTKGAAIGQESRCHEAQGCARVAISSFFTSFALLTVHPCTTPHYARQANRTTLHAVITMEGVRAGFAWSKNLSNYGF